MDLYPKNRDLSRPPTEVELRVDASDLRMRTGDVHIRLDAIDGRGADIDDRGRAHAAGRKQALLDLLVLEVVVEGGDVESAGHPAFKASLGADFVRIHLLRLVGVTAAHAGDVDPALAIAAAILAVDQDVFGRMIVDAQQPGRRLRPR